MADTKISALTAVVTPAGTDTLAAVQGGVTKKLTVTQLLAAGDSPITGSDFIGTIGATTPAAGAFTTAIISSDSNQFRVLAPSGNAWLQLADSAAGGTRKEFTVLLDVSNNRVDIEAVQQGTSAWEIRLNPAGGGAVSCGGTLAVTGVSTFTGSVVTANAARATDVTDGFLYIPTCAGVPSGTPTTKTGTCAIIFDTTNNDLYLYDAAWLKVAMAA